MTRYVALLRGINVGRAKRVAMADLRSLVADLGGHDVRTILNSGNVVFAAPRETPARLARRIESAMADRLGVSAAVTVLAADVFEKIVEENPLLSVADNPSRLLVAFGGDASRAKELRTLTRRQWGPEALAVGSAATYLWCPTGILASRLLEAVGSILGTTMTARNWSTVERIQRILQPSASATRARPAVRRSR